MTPTPTQALEPVEVTRAATDAAKEFIRGKRIPRWEAAAIQAFARFEHDCLNRHRQSSNAASVGVEYCSHCQCDACDGRNRDQSNRSAIAMDAGARCWSCSCGWVGCYTGLEIAKYGEPSECAKCYRERLVECEQPKALASLSTPTAEPTSPCPGDGMREADIALLGARMVLEGKATNATGALAKSDWKPSRAHIEGMRNTMREAIEYIDEARAALAPSPLSDPHPLGQEYDGDALREALANAKCAFEYWERESKVWLDSRVAGARPGWMAETRRRGREEIARIARALSATPATAVDETDRLREALEPFARVARINYPLAADWSDDRHNSNFMPSAWPDWGDFKRADRAFSGEAEGAEK